jgi:hypothetical protein
MTDRLTWDDAVATHTALAQLHDETSNFLADALDLLTAYSVGRQDRLGRLAALRTQAAELLGQTQDALADLERVLEALEPDEPTLTVEDR